MPATPSNGQADSPGSTEASLRTTLLRHRTWILLALTILFVTSVRLRILDTPLERDEGEYAYAGQLLLQGAPPYKFAYNMKLPGTYAAYALIMALFGQSASGIHFGLLLVNIASILLIFRLGARILDEPAGLAAAVAFALLTLSTSVLGQAAHATHFVVLPALGGALLLLRAAETGRFRDLALSGLLFGLAFVMKQHGVFFGLFGFIYLLRARAQAQKDPRPHPWMRTRSKPLLWGKYAKELAIFSAGLAAPYLAVCLLLWIAGVLPAFIFWTINYARSYVSIVSLDYASGTLRTSLSTVTGPTAFFWILAMVGAGFMWLDRRVQKYQFFLTGWFLASCASISVGLYFRSHYFVLMLPIVSLLAGIAVSRALYLIRHDSTVELILALPAIGLFGLAIVISIALNGEAWFALRPAKLSGSIYGNNLFVEARPIGNYIGANIPRNASIAVLGSEPEIYFYARRRSATGYIYMYPLGERHALTLKMQQQMIEEIESAKPEYIVFVNETFSWLSGPEAFQPIFDWWRDYSAAHYELVRMATIEGGVPLGSSVAVPASLPGGGKFVEESRGSHFMVLKRKKEAPGK